MSQRSDMRQINEKASTAPLAIAIFAIFSALVFALVWSAQTRVPELVRASGQIGPLNDLDRLDHFDGGIVKNLYVNPGDEVEEGQLLAVIEQPNLRSELRTTEERIAILEKDRYRLRTVLEGLSSDPDAKVANVANSDEKTPLSAYVDSQESLFRARRTSMSARIARLELEVVAASDILENARTRLGLAESALSRDEALLARHLIPESELLERRASTQQIREHVLESEMGVLRARDQLQDATAQLVEAETAWKEELLAKLYELDGELSALSVQFAELTRKAARSELHAPQDGVIQSMDADAVGQVVSPGGPVMQILASDEALVARVKLAPKDIGHVFVGARVHIRPTTFDFRRFGDITGHISSISPTSQMDERNTPYFHAVVALDHTTIGKGQNRRGLHAGMEISADITTSDRTVLSYFLRPAERVMSVSLTER